MVLVGEIPRMPEIFANLISSRRAHKKRDRCCGSQLTKSCNKVKINRNELFFKFNINIFSRSLIEHENNSTTTLEEQTKKERLHSFFYGLLIIAIFIVVLIVVLIVLKLLAIKYNIIL